MTDENTHRKIGSDAAALAIIMIRQYPRLNALQTEDLTVIASKQTDGRSLPFGAALVLEAVTAEEADFIMTLELRHRR